MLAGVRSTLVSRPITGALGASDVTKSHRVRSSPVQVSRLEVRRRRTVGARDGSSASSARVLLVRFRRSMTSRAQAPCRKVLHVHRLSRRQDPARAPQAPRIPSRCSCVWARRWKKLSRLCSYRLERPVELAAHVMQVGAGGQHHALYRTAPSAKRLVRFSVSSAAASSKQFELDQARPHGCHLAIAASVL